ncbi:MAG: hypothetical protein N2234_08190 [Planctomycetota bacterium]|nr:hypothetical protein [Planctomycetota bacterium]
MDWWTKNQGYFGAAASTASTAAGIGIGAFLGGLPGAAAGAAIGGAVGGSLSSLFALGAKPEIPRITGDQMVSMKRAQDIAARAVNLQGMSPAEVSAYQDVIYRNEIRQQNIMNAFNSVYAMGAAEQEVLAKSILDRERLEASRQEKELALLNADRVRQNVEIAIKANESAARQASLISEMERRRKIMQLQFESEKWKNFAAGMTGAAEGVAGAIAYYQARLDDMNKNKNAATTENKNGAVANANEGTGIAAGTGGEGWMSDRDSNRRFDTPFRQNVFEERLPQGSNRPPANKSLIQRDMLSPWAAEVLSEYFEF